jgi:molecular chaperone Hsp33
LFRGAAERVFNMSTMLTSVSRDGSVSVTVLECREIVEKARSIHSTTPVCTAALGRLLAAASMLGKGLKGESNSVTLRIKGGGEAGSIVAVSDSGGNVRGDIANPFADLPLNGQGKLDVAGVVGKNGTLAVLKDLGLKEPYCGQTNIVSGEIAEDITHYFAKSEQIPTCCALGVLVETNLSVKEAGGFLVQLLPGFKGETADRIDQNIKKLEPTTTMLNVGLSVLDITKRIFDGLEFAILEEITPQYECKCSRKKVEKAIISLGVEEIKELAEKSEPAEIKCHFCGKHYYFERGELLKLLKEASDK